MTASTPVNWIGIDVSKATLDVYDLSHQHRVQFTNDPEGIAQLTTYLLACPNAAVVCEATGGYEQAMARQLHQSGLLWHHAWHSA